MCFTFFKTVNKPWIVVCTALWYAWFPRRFQKTRWYLLYSSTKSNALRLSNGKLFGRVI